MSHGIPRRPSSTLTVQLVAAATGEPVRDVADALRRSPARPETYDHPLAVAARCGRGFALTHIGLADPTDPAQLRAFEVARARARAKRWGWRSAQTAAGAGRDNRGQRRHRGA